MRYLLKTNKFALLILILLIGAASGYSQSIKMDRSGKTGLCDRISQIKELPYSYDEKGIDQNYDALYEAGENAIPCLIAKITDESIMPDPRCPRISEETKVGDVAYFVLVGITKFKFEEMLPVSVQRKYKTEGVYAYHRYIDRKGSRRELQSRLRQWYQQKQKS